MDKVYGINPVRVLLDQPHPPVKKIILAVGRGGNSVKDILDHAREKKIPVEWKERQYLDELTGRQDHQGVVGIRESFHYSDMDAVLQSRNPRFAHDLIIILDGVMDPQNLGSIIRTSHCLGANGVLIPTDRAAGVTSAVLKVSAGSAEIIPVARVTNLSRAVDELKSRGFWIFGAEAHGGTPVNEVDFDCPVALILGGEAKGIRPLLKKKCDFLVNIPMAGSFDSFNVAVAAGIIQYQILLGRKSSRK